MQNHDEQPAHEAADIETEIGAAIDSEIDAEIDEEIEIEAIGIEVNSQPIELYKVLKMANVVSGGGEAKYAIAEGYVVVNGELELRKRRKMYDGDLVEFNGEYYLVICDIPADESPQAESVREKASKSHKNKPRTLGAEKVSQHKDKSHAAKKKSSKSRQEKSADFSLIKGKHYRAEPEKAPLDKNRTVENKKSVENKTPENTETAASETTERDTRRGRGSIKFF